MTAWSVDSARALKRSGKYFLRAISNGWSTPDGITRSLQKLGVRPGGVMLVHSSLSSLGFVPGGAQTAIKALLAAVGRDGTLVLPTHSWERAGRGDFTFDIRSTPSCVGRISETFRTMPGAIRSLHPTHSVAAMGPRAEYLTQGHELAATPCGKGTPYAKLIEEHCQILFLGTTLDQNTIFHTLEDFARAPYLMRNEDESFIITNAAGTMRSMQFRRHDRGPDRRFNAMQGFLEARAILRKGNVAAAASLLVECAPMAELILPLLQNNPRHLLK